MGESPAGLNKAAMQALAAGDFATAEALLLRLVAVDPASIPAWLNLAALRRRLNNVDGAFAALGQVMRL
jgi:aspartate beta-hydroxylase